MCTLLVAVSAHHPDFSRGCRAPGCGVLWIKRVFALAMFGVAEYYLIKMDN